MFTFYNETVEQKKLELELEKRNAEIEAKRKLAEKWFETLSQNTRNLFNYYFRQYVVAVELSDKPLIK